MNNSEQAKNGFKTFLVTFGVSLLVFGFFYYLISDTPVNDVSIEGNSGSDVGYTSNSTKEENPTVYKKVKESEEAENKAAGPYLDNYSVALPTDSEEKDTRMMESSGQVAGASDVKSPVGDVNSPFGELVKTTPNVQPKTVLAGADVAETTQTTTSAPVPETGDFGMTVALMLSLGLLAFFVYILFLNPRKYALSKFENDVLDEL